MKWIKILLVHFIDSYYDTDHSDELQELIFIRNSTVGGFALLDD